MLSVINAARLSVRRPALGLLNPAIWSYGTAITNDIVTGNNKCTASSICCAQGFPAAVGWDPATGFGSVRRCLVGNDCIVTLL